MNYEDYAGQAWHFRRDPREIEGAWAKLGWQPYLHVARDRLDRSAKGQRAFNRLYVDRLGRVLSEAVPGVGGLSAEPEW